tara:strand:+ start:605 stop:733 length:129 start_codon:yes stop_codon:yes gene_type:complete
MSTLNPYKPDPKTPPALTSLQLSIAEQRKAAEAAKKKESKSE